MAKVAHSTASCCISSDMSAFLITAFRSLMIACSEQRRGQLEVAGAAACQDPPAKQSHRYRPSQGALGALQRLRRGRRGTGTARARSRTNERRLPRPGATQAPPAAAAALPAPPQLGSPGRGRSRSGARPRRPPRPGTGGRSPAASAKGSEPRAATGEAPACSPRGGGRSSRARGSCQRARAPAAQAQPSR